MIARWPVILILAIIAASIGIAGGYVYPNPTYRPQTIDLNEVDPLELMRQAKWQFAVVTDVTGAKVLEGPELVSVAGVYNWGQLLIVINETTDGRGNVVYESEDRVWVPSGSLAVYPDLQQAVNAATELRVAAIVTSRTTATAIAAGSQ